MSDNYYKDIFSKNLKYYMSINQKSQVDLVNDLGYDKSAVSTWCNGTRLPRMDKVDAIAKYLGVRRSDLIDERAKDNPAPVSLREDEEFLLSMYNLLDNEDRAEVRGYVRGLMRSEKYIDDSVQNVG